jgi:hypothetical protein
MTPRFGLVPCLAVLLSVAPPSGPVRAASTDEAALCERAIITGAQTGGIPQQVLHAISLTETGRKDGGRLRPWPWAINREGQGHWFPNREQALAFAQKSLAEGRTSFDVGCFQINYKYHGHNFRSLESMFEPETGANYAARFLGDPYAEKRDWSAAAGAYHSRTPHYANIYRARFDRILAGIGVLPKQVRVQVAAAEEVPEAPTRKSRMRMTRKPLIITIPKPDKDPEALPARGANPERSAGASLRMTDAAPTTGVDRLPGVIAAQRRF